MLNVTKPGAPLFAWLLVHVKTNAPLVIPAAVTVTRNIFLVVADVVNAVVVAPPIVAVHVVAPVLAQISWLAVISSVSVSANAVVIPIENTKFPGCAPDTFDVVVSADVHVNCVGAVVMV